MVVCGVLDMKVIILLKKINYGKLFIIVFNE